MAQGTAVRDTLEAARIIIGTESKWAEEMLMKIYEPHDRYCAKHKKLVAREQNKTNSKIYTYQWRKASKAYLKDNLLCVHCQGEGRLTPATEVDHVIPHNGDMKLFWDWSNW